MTKDKIVPQGWYRIVLTSGQKITGKCLSAKSRILPTGKETTVYGFDTGEDEDELHVNQNLLIMAQADIKSAVRLSQRYIEIVKTKSKGWTHYRYKGLFKYGEE